MGLLLLAIVIALLAIILGLTVHALFWLLLIVALVALVLWFLGRSRAVP
jgi:hypothetical protein